MVITHSSSKNSVNKNLVLLGLLFLCVGIYYGYSVLLTNLKATKTNYLTLQARDQGLQEDIKSLRDAESKLAEAKNKLSDNGVNLSMLGNVAPEFEDIPSLYLQLEDLVKRDPNLAGVTYQLSAPVTDSEGKSKVPVTFAASGQYKDLKQFIITLEQNIRPISLSSIVFSPGVTTDVNGRKQELPGQYTLNATGFVSVRKLSQAYAKGSAVAP